jgi:hypothetical protein
MPKTSRGPSESEKARITAACERFIEQILKPRFLPAIVPTPFNYPVDIQGKWQGPRYRFIQRYRSGFPENLGEEFDAPSSASTGSAQTASTSSGIGTPAPGIASTAANPSPRP